MKNNKPHIICFGEILWDLLPTEKLAGGAPLNVAYHAQNLGLSAQIISKIGVDELGAELLAFLKQKGVDTELIQTDFTFPTGTVKVELDEIGSPSYDIVAPVAWDFIHPHPTALAAIKDADVLVFGSLACRKERTQQTLFELLEIAKVKVFDVNLRPPFYSKDLLEVLLQKADIVKMNDEELEIIGDWLNTEKDETSRAKAIRAHYNLQVLIVTKGAKGAIAVDEKDIFSTDGLKIKVQDTIGSGDSFLAGFLSQYLKGKSTAESLAFAGKIGALVATKKGGTPIITTEEIAAY